MATPDLELVPQSPLREDPLQDSIWKRWLDTILTRLKSASYTTSEAYVSGSGTAGVDATAQTVVTRTARAGLLRQLGDRVRIYTYWRGDTGGGITATLKVNGVTVAATTDAGGTTIQLTETWLQYIDSTHANVIAFSNGALNTTISAANVAGFTWDANQDVIVTQDNVANNHIIVFALVGDIHRYN